MPRNDRSALKVGMAPGSLVYTGEKKNQEFKIRVVRFSANSFHEYDIFNVKDIIPLLQGHEFTWISVIGLNHVEKIEEILSASGVDSEVLAKLGDGFNQLGESAKSLAEISGATVATREFVGHLQNASNSIGSLHETYNETAESIKQSATSLSGAYFETADSIKKSGLEVADTYKEMASVIKQGHQNIAQGGKDYEEQLTLLKTNLANLNNVYLNQIKETSEQMKGSQALYTGLHDMISNLKASVDETNKYKEEISKLKENISSLNNIYGNMLNSMASAKKK